MQLPESLHERLAGEYQYIAKQVDSAGSLQDQLYSFSAFFGEAARLSPPGSSTLHHVEELRSRPEEIPRGATGEDGTKDELEPPQDRHKSA